MSNSLWPHRLQHARPPLPSPTPGACSNSCPLSRWCHPAISASVIPFSSCLQSFPTSKSFPMSWLFASGGQSIGVSASASVLPINIQDFTIFFLGNCKMHSTTIKPKTSRSGQAHIWARSLLGSEDQSAVKSVNNGWRLDTDTCYKHLLKLWSSQKRYLLPAHKLFFDAHWASRIVSRACPWTGATGPN